MQQNGTELNINKIIISPTNIHNAPVGRSWLYTEDRSAEAIIVEKVAEEYRNNRQRSTEGFISPFTSVKLQFDNDTLFKDSCFKLLELSKAYREVSLSAAHPDWDKPVYAFEMHASGKFAGAIEVTRYLITGYIVNCDDVLLEEGKVIGVLGNPKFTVNHIFELRPVFNVKPYGMEKSEILACSNEIIHNPMYAGIDDKNQLEVSDLEGVIRFQSVIDSGFLSGVEVVDLRSTINHVPRAVNSTDNDPSQFITKYFEALLAAKIQGENLNQSEHFMRENMQRIARPVSIRRNPVLKAIAVCSETDAGILTSEFDLKTIRIIDPEVEIKYDNVLVNDWRNVTRNWNNHDPVTMFASFVTQLVVSRMESKGWRDMAMEIKEERDAEGRARRNFNASAKSLLENSDNLADFEPLSQLCVEIAHHSFLSTYKNWTIGISANLLGTTMISINTDGDECIYASPTFASARFSPSVATSKDHVRHMAECFLKLEDQFNERV